MYIYLQAAHNYAWHWFEVVDTTISLIRPRLPHNLTRPTETGTLLQTARSGVLPRERREVDGGEGKRVMVMVCFFYSQS